MAAVLLAGRVVPVVSPERHPDATIIALMLAYPVALLGAAMICCGSILRLIRGSRDPVGPLLAGLVAVAMVLIPLDPVLRELDDRLHQGAREDIVRRLESGELKPRWYSAPPGRLVEAPERGTLLVAVPLEYSAAVSNAGVQATFDPALTRAVFLPHRGIGNRMWAVVYDRDDIAPAGDKGVVGGASSVSSGSVSAGTASSPSSPSRRHQRLFVARWALLSRGAPAC